MGRPRIEGKYIGVEVAYRRQRRTIIGSRRPAVRTEQALVNGRRITGVRSPMQVLFAAVLFAAGRYVKDYAMTKPRLLKLVPEIVEVVDLAIRIAEPADTPAGDLSMRRCSQCLALGRDEPLGVGPEPAQRVFGRLVVDSQQGTNGNQPNGRVRVLEPAT